MLVLIMLGTGLGYVIYDRNVVVYPQADEILTVGKCGQTFFKQPSTSIRIERYRCYVTDESPAQVQAWYFRQGYRLQNGGFVREDLSFLGRRYFSIERVYTYIEDEKTIIRVYDDTIVRFR